MAIWGRCSRTSACPVVFGGVTVNGILDEFDQREQAGQAWVDLVDRVVKVTIKTGSLPGIANESLLTVNSKSYSVRDMIQEHDGGLTSLYCIKQVFAPT